MAAYADIRDALERAAGHTNGQFADTDWTPVRYLNKDFPHETLSGFLRVANVGVVTPLRDGMNLVAKEFVAAQDPEDPGALVLSSMAGAARELSDALLVNPYDRSAVALALRQALAMPLAERRTRHEAMMKVLRANSIARWYGSFLEILESVQPVRKCRRRSAASMHCASSGTSEMRTRPRPGFSPCASRAMKLPGNTVRFVRW